MKMRTKIVLLVVGITISVGIGSCLIVNRMVGTAIENELHTHATIAIQGIAEQVTLNVINGEVIKARDALRKMLARSHRIKYAYILDFDKRLFTHTFEGGFPKGLVGFLAEQPLSYEFPVMIHFKTTAGRCIEVCSPLIEGMNANIHIGMDDEPTHATMAVLRNSILWMTLLLSVMGILIGVFVSQRMTHPLANLAKAMGNFGQRKDDGELTYHGRSKELIHLTHAFNRMISDRKSTEEALRISEERHRAILQTAMDGFWMADHQGRLLEVNDTYCRMSGYSKPELLTMRFQELRPPETANETIAHMQKIMTEGEDRFQSCHRRKDGTLFEVEVCAQYRQSEGGQFVVFIRDITDRVQAEEALRESDQNFRNLANSGRALIWAAGTDKLCNYFNRIWLEFTGRTLEQEWGNGWAEGVHPEDFQRCLNIYTGAFDRRESFSMAYRLRRYDGEYRWIIDDGSPRFDSKGEFIGYVGHCLDITERRVAEEALRSNEERLKAILKATPDPIVLYDVNGYPQYLNPAFTEVFGWTLDELSGRQIPFVPGDQNEITAQKITETYESGKTVKIQTKRLTKAGVPIDVIVSAAIIQGREGKPTGLVVNITDISDYKKLEARLQQAQKLESIGTLAGGIAHDFNNILYPLLGFTELLKEDIPADSPLQDHIDEILNATMRSKNLVKQILAFSRKGDQSAKPIQLQPIVKEALKLLRASIPTTIEIQQDIDSDGDVVMADPTQIHQIVMNLATNAYHAMEDTGGILKVSLKKSEVLPESVSESNPSVFQTLLPGNYVLLTVSDTGTGITKDILDKIFEPYFTTKGIGKGTGLGLSVVHGIVKAHKGEIWISSVPGIGTEVQVYLPVMERTVEDKRIESSEPLLGGTERILLVDDEEAVVRLEKQMLERLGYHVEERTSSIEALNAFTAHPEAFELVISDMTMPKMTGIQLAGALILIRPDIPVVICTGFSEKIDDEKTKSKGIKGFLMKPVDKSEMAKMVRKVLDEAKGSGGNDVALSIEKTVETRERQFVL
jgi:PAS domain S-box-containing protein